MRRVGLTVALSLFFVIGCGSTDIAPVSGKVVCNGKPVTPGTVIFQPKNGKAAAGTLDDQGAFTLTTDRHGDGAKIGTHTVSVSIDPYKTKISCGLASQQIEIKSGQNDIVIDLSSSKK